LFGLTKDYGLDRGVFDLDLTVQRGEVSGFVGHDGAGKHDHTAAHGPGSAPTGAPRRCSSSSARRTAWHLAAEAHRRRYEHHAVKRWQTTLLGDFALDEWWRQVGQSPITIEWRGGRQDPATLQLGEVVFARTWLADLRG
jgi:hypothetical protein